MSSDLADIRPELVTFFDRSVIESIDGSEFVGIPLRQMSKTELMAACIVLGELGKKLLLREMP